MSLYGSTDQQTFSNISATTSPFTLKGGCFGVTVSATWGGGSVDLKRLGPDGSTYISVLSSAFSSNGYQTVNIPPGTYEVVIATATAVYVDITSVYSSVA